jgi:hypothetical protein
MATINGFDPAALSIDGARHRGELWRVGLYASTSGSEGIVETPDCKVSQLSTAGAGVSISAGAVLIRNRSASVRNQSYAANGRVTSQVDITATGASGRSDMVVIRVKDPQYSPWGALSGADTQYVEPFVIQNVPASTTRASELNLGYSATELARIDIPANTTVITSAMIKDMRKLAQPRRERHVLVLNPGISDATGATNVREQLSNMDNPIFCPDWASELKLIVTVSQARYNGVMNGAIRAEYGYGSGDNPTFLATQDSGLDAPTGNVTTRTTVVAAGELVIPASYRGKTHNVRLGAMRTVGTGSLSIDQWTTFIVDAEFVQVPD